MIRPVCKLYTAVIDENWLSSDKSAGDYRAVFENVFENMPCLCDELRLIIGSKCAVAVLTCGRNGACEKDATS